MLLGQQQKSNSPILVNQLICMSRIASLKSSDLLRSLSFSLALSEGGEVELLGLLLVCFLGASGGRMYRKVYVSYSMQTLWSKTAVREELKEPTTFFPISSLAKQIVPARYCPAVAPFRLLKVKLGWSVKLQETLLLIS
jgi:hypothetical protein